MLLESAALSVVFAVVVSVATAQLLTGLGAALLTAAASQAPAAPAPLDPATALMLSLGAGLYEELLFRVLLVTGIAAGLRALLGMSAMTAGVIACVASAILRVPLRRGVR